MIRPTSNPGRSNSANYVVLEHGDGLCSLYLHLQHHGVLVQEGEEVKRGQPIALSGCTGYSTGPHLHFQIQTKGTTWWQESVPLSSVGGFADVSTVDGIPRVWESYVSENSFMQSESPTLDHVSLSGVGAVDEDTSADYTCTAHFTDDSSTDVTASVIWSENSPYASITTGGRLSVGSLSSDSTCTVTASYTYEGVTKTATKTVTLRDAPLTLDHVSLSGVGAVDEDTSADYTCTAHFTDDSSTDVTASVIWSENSPYASITTGGRLSVGSLSSDSTCTVTASYTYEGVTKTATKTVTLLAFTEEGSPYLNDINRVFDDDNVGSSVGNGDGVVQPGETIELRITYRNQGTATAHNVQGRVSFSDPQITVLNGSVNYPDLAPWETSNGSQSYVFEVSLDHPGGYVSYRHDVDYDEGSNGEYDPVEIQSP